MSESRKILNLQNKLSFIVLADPYISMYMDSFMKSFKTIDNEYGRNVFAKWKIQYQHKNDGVNFRYRSCIVSDIAGQNYELFLYTHPDALLRDYLIDDLQMPTKVRGAIIFVEAFPKFIESRRWLNILNEIKNDPNMCAIAWAKWNHLPFIIILIKEAEQAAVVSSSDLIRIFDLPPNTPFISCPSGLNQENIQEILSVTLNHIKSNIP